jgi:hypothetical protein
VAAGGAGADVLPGRAAGDPRRATATLDAKAEHGLFARIGELFSDRSVLLISHRSADRIYVLNEGLVVGSGRIRSSWPLGDVCGVIRAAGVAVSVAAAGISLGDATRLIVFLDNQGITVADLVPPPL